MFSRLRSSCLAASLGLVLLLPAAASAGPLFRCCSKGGSFCIRDFKNTDAQCGDLGGTVSMANGCSNAPACVVAHQVAATGEVQIKKPAEPPKVVPVQGKGDVIEIEIVQLELKSVPPPPPVPERVVPKKQPGTAAPHNFNPGGFSFWSMSFEIGLPDVSTRVFTAMPVQFQANTPIGTTFPPYGIPYFSTGPVPLVDGMGMPAGDLLGVMLTFQPQADADGDAVADDEDSCPGTAPGASIDEFGCSDAQHCGPDGDGDGKVDAMDACPGTAAAAAIDDSGCSLVQFCSAQNATTAAGKSRCKKLDWKNDEPMPKPIESDCVVDRGGLGMADDLCKPRP